MNRWQRLQVQVLEDAQTEMAALDQLDALVENLLPLHVLAGFVRRAEVCLEIGDPVCLHRMLQDMALAYAPATWESVWSRMGVVPPTVKAAKPVRREPSRDGLLVNSHGRVIGSSSA